MQTPSPTGTSPTPAPSGTPEPAADKPRSRSLRSRPTRLIAATVTLLVFGLIAAIMAPAAASAGHRSTSGSVVVANRGSGDISVIDTSTLDVVNHDLPGEAEPMYVNHDRRNGRVLVGDRASSTIVAFDDETYDVAGSVEVGDGIFHQWLDDRRQRLWVVGTEESTVSVVDSRNLELITTFALPDDVIAAGGVPHDVFVSGNLAFVSVLDLADGGGLVIQYNSRTFAETGRIETGGDPHLFVSGNDLYVASQDGNSVSRFQARSLNLRGTVEVPAAHGIFVTRRGEVFATNIAGGGVDGVWELNRRLNRTIDVTDTDVATPHNLTVDNQRQVWVTHSGETADQVSIIDLERRGFGSPTTVTAGTNPFGLAFVRS